MKNFNISTRYQDGEKDQYYHAYCYDAENRITHTHTSVNGNGSDPTVHDSKVWDTDAKYFYYSHGPLARTELGDQKVQAMDFAYTIQGWLKGVNSNTLVETRDIGKDGETSTTNLNAKVGRDAYGTAEARRDLPLGRVVLEEDVVRAWTVKRGDLVQLEVKSGDVVAQVRGIVMSNGRIGDRVSVKLQSNDPTKEHEVSARVVNRSLLR
ncbi:MAG: hypothetical protein COB59_08475, partial [Rhodospirillaceae bacterium]